jgi:secondary thiamine-phosphate synthase enzyme
MKIIKFSSEQFEDMANITSQVYQYVKDERIKDGEILLQTPENSVGITLADPKNKDMTKDYLKALDHAFPRFNGMQYTGPSTPGIKAAMVGQSLRLTVHEGSLVLGLHQGIFAADFGGPKKDRMIFISHVGSTLKPGEEAKGSPLLRAYNEKVTEEERKAKEEEKKVIEDMRREYREQHPEYFKNDGKSILKEHMKPQNKPKNQDNN